MPDVLPQIILTGLPSEATPPQALSATLEVYRREVRKTALQRLATIPDITAEVLQAILAEVIHGHFNPIQIFMGATLRIVAQHSVERQLVPLSDVEAAQIGHAAAGNLGAYFAETSTDAVMDGFHRLVNLQVPPREAARRVLTAFGLTKPQMRAMLTMKEQAVASSDPNAKRGLIDAYIDRVFRRRVEVIVINTIAQVGHDAVQDAWQAAKASGLIPATAKKVWFTAEDERTCPICAPMDGTAVDVDDTFHLPDGNRVKNPPVHVNCRCTVELDQTEDWFGKAEQFDPKLHPRGQRGRFATKTAVAEPPELNLEMPTEQELARIREHEELHGPEGAEGLKPLVAPAKVKTAPRVRTQVRPASAPKLALRTGLSSAPTMGSAPSMTTAPSMRSAPSMASAPAMGSAPAMAPLSTIPAPSRIMVGNRMVSVANLNVERQVNIAANLNSIEQQLPPSAKPSLPPQTRPLGPQYVGFATFNDLNTDGTSEMGGKMQLMKPVRFVSFHDTAGIEKAFNAAAEELDQHLRNHPIEPTLVEVEQASDDAVQDLGVHVREIVGNREGIYLSVESDDAVAAWKALRWPKQNGQVTSEFQVTIYDHNGPIESIHAPAATIAALSNDFEGNASQFAPEVIIAPHGTWDTASGVGATTHAPNTIDRHDVSGPFDWTRRSGDIIEIVPDEAAYRRANPEHLD